MHVDPVRAELDAAAKTIAEAAPQLRGKEPAIAEALARQAEKTGFLQRFGDEFKSPLNWVAELLSIWAGSKLPTDTMTQLVVGVGSGAAVMAVSAYLKELGLQRPAHVAPFIDANQASRLDRQKDTVLGDFVIGAAREIERSTAYSPSRSRDDEAWQRAIRHAMVDPRFMRMIV